VTPSTTLNVVVVLFAGYMLLRHLPRAWAFARGRAKGQPMAMVSAVNVVLALVILGYAVRGLTASLLGR
jgi:hypothetical protein